MSVLFVFALFLTLLLSFNAKPVSAANCASGDLFNSVTGQACISTSLVVSCPTGDIFSTTTGKRCNTWTENTGNNSILDTLFKRQLAMGSKGEDVKVVQQILKDANFLSGKVDGIYGPITKSAVMKYQAENSITTTGVVGSDTLEKIKLTPWQKMCPLINSTYGVSYSCSSVAPACVSEGGSLGAVVPGNIPPPSCCPGLMAYAPRDIAGTFGTCVKSTNQTLIISGISGPTVLDVGQTGTWTVMANDSEQGVLSYNVSWGDIASSASAMSANFVSTATFSHIYNNVGIYTAKFTVKNSQGLTAETTINVNVVDSTSPVLSKYKCSETGCVQDDANGTFTSSTCDNSCNVGVVPKYKCANTGCVQDNVNGTFTSSTCNNMCSPSCVKATSCPQGIICGAWTDGCGGYIGCGNCNFGYYCGEHQKVCERQFPSGPRTISTSGGSNLKVVSNLAGINCGQGGTQCRATFNESDTVILTATPSTGYSFMGWSGYTNAQYPLLPGFGSDCATKSGTCTITMSTLMTDVNVGASVELTPGTTYYDLVVKNGWGKITGNKGTIECEGAGNNKICRQRYNVGDLVTLIAQVTDPIYTFKRWTAGCSCENGCSQEPSGCSTNGTCSLTIPQSTQSDLIAGIDACFVAPANYKKITVSAQFVGGYVSDSIGKMQCGVKAGSSMWACGYDYSPTSVIKFTAHPEAGYKFNGWSGYRNSQGLVGGFGSDCADLSAGTCTVNMSAMTISSVNIGWSFARQ